MSDLSAFLVSLLLGDDSKLSRPLQELFRSVGISHVTAASGANIGFFESLAGVLPFSLPRIWKVLLSVSFVGSFLILASISGSLLRSSLFWFFGWLVRIQGRRSSDFLLAFGSIFVGWICFPDYSRTDGFILSALAFSGVIFSRALLSGEKNSLLFPQMYRWVHAFLLAYQKSSVILCLVSGWVWWRFQSFVPIGSLLTVSLEPLFLFFQIFGIWWLALALRFRNFAVGNFFFSLIDSFGETLFSLFVFSLRGALLLREIPFFELFLFGGGLCLIFVSFLNIVRLRAERQWERSLWC